MDVSSQPTEHLLLPRLRHFPPAHICGSGTCVHQYKHDDVHMSERRSACRFVNELIRHTPGDDATNRVPATRLPRPLAGAPLHQWEGDDWYRCCIIWQQRFTFERTGALCERREPRDRQRRRRADGTLALVPCRPLISYQKTEYSQSLRCCDVDVNKNG